MARFGGAQGFLDVFPCLNIGAELCPERSIPFHRRENRTRLSPFGDKHFFASSNPAQHVTRAVFELFGADRLHRKWLFDRHSSPFPYSLQVQNHCFGGMS